MTDQPITPAQTVGPFFGFALPYQDGSVIVEAGELRVYGSVTDGDGALVPDALIEVLQADAEGRLETGLFGRSHTRPSGRFAFTTVKPGGTADGCAPHLAFIVHARGLLLHLHTRMYFPDETEANRADPVLSAVPKARRASLIGEATDDCVRFDIRLQGAAETVFFDV